MRDVPCLRRAHCSHAAAWWSAGVFGTSGCCRAGTVAEALRLAPLTDPDVAVLDVRLPDGDGVTVCRELRSRLPHLRCVLLTSPAEEDALLAAILGAPPATS